VAKRVDSWYRPGLRSRSWTMAKHFRTRNFARLVGCLGRSGVRTGVALFSLSAPTTASRWPVLSNRVRAAISSNSFRAHVG
jgi:ATP-dependent DNA ligase